MLMPTKMVSFNIAKSQIDRQDPHQNLVGVKCLKKKKEAPLLAPLF